MAGDSQTKLSLPHFPYSRHHFCQRSPWSDWNGGSKAASYFDPRL